MGIEQVSAIGFYPKLKEFIGCIWSLEYKVQNSLLSNKPYKII